MTLARHRTRSLLRALIHRCENDIIVQRRASIDLTRPGHRARLSATTRQRQSFVAELEAALHALGGHPSWFGSPFVKLHTLARRAGRVVIGQHDGDTFAICAGMAHRTSDAYERALRHELSENLSHLLERQHEVIAKTCTDFSYARGTC